DEDGEIARKFGVPFGPGATVKAKDADGNPIEFKRAGTAARWTFVVGKDGKLAYKNTKVNPLDDAKKITQLITKAGDKCGGVSRGDPVTAHGSPGARTDLWNRFRDPARCQRVALRGLRPVAGLAQAARPRRYGSASGLGGGGWRGVLWGGFWAVPPCPGLLRGTA